MGRLATVTDDRGTTTRHYDQPLRPTTTTYAYDDLNRLTTVTEKKGTTTLFSQTFILNDDDTCHSVHETELQPGGTTTVTTDTTWTYDAQDRLTGETLTSSDTSRNYANVFHYDLNGNRTKQEHAGPGTGPSETVTYTYNGDDQLTDQVAVSGGTTTTTHFDYDANGSQVDTKVNGTQTATYTYDVRNKMVGYSTTGGGGTTAGYVYDDAGNRVQETVNGTTTYYLTDTQNPTGYAQPIEARPSQTGTPTVTYLVGDCVYGQVDPKRVARARRKGNSCGRRIRA